MSTLIKNGTLVSSSDEQNVDVLFSETIENVGPGLESSDSEVFDASGKYVLPGLIDPHLHIQLDTGIYSTPDNWKIGSREAALGGFTTVIDFATQFPEMNFEEALTARLAEIEGNTTVDVGLHMMVTNLEKCGSQKYLTENGIRSVKVYTTYRPNYFQDDSELLSIMKEAAEQKLLILVHAENDAMVSAASKAFIDAGKKSLRHHGAARPEFAEVTAANTCLLLAEEAGADLYIVHNSSPRTVELIAKARASGQKAFSETCPQYLTLDDTLYESDEPWRYILQPPLRAPKFRDWLWKKVLSGDVQSIGTDHCDYSIDQKTEADDFITTCGGLPGLQMSFHLMHHFGVGQHGMTMSDLVRLMSENQAKIFELWPKKGCLEPGADGDVVVFDPHETWTVDGSKLFGTAKYSPWDGLEVKGRVTDVWSRGRRILKDGAFCGDFSHGVYLRERKNRVYV
ncbi:MAG: amidohydrolase family protein [Candidatus Lindowbacteria bacterium]|nr:amidohydrolase family protein [Candidatus Lindowbacteria bacterium]